MDALSLALDTFAPLEGRAILDIGCGPGAFAAALAKRGAAVTGIDTGEAAVAAARARVPGARFEIGSAEGLPFADASFDGAVILNALHHVPDPARALAEAARVARDAVLVVEPLAEGSYFAALVRIEDETAIRAEAQAAIVAAVEAGLYRLTRDVRFERREVFAGLDPFLERVAAVDPARRAVIAAEREAIAAAFEAAAERDAEGFALIQPLRAQVLVPLR